MRGQCTQEELSTELLLCVRSVLASACQAIHAAPVEIDLLGPRYVFRLALPGLNNGFIPESVDASMTVYNDRDTSGQR